MAKTRLCQFTLNRLLNYILFSNYIMVFGRLASKAGGFLSGVGKLADKGSSVTGKLASPLKTGVSVVGGLLDPVTGGLSGKIAGAVNKGIMKVWLIKKNFHLLAIKQQTKDGYVID